MKKVIIATKKKISHNSASKGLFLFVVIPTILSIIYYTVLASDIYVSESRFSVNVEGKNVTTSPLGALMPTFSASASMHEAMIVREYIHSPTMVEKLQKNSALKRVFDNAESDFISRIPSDLPLEEYVERFKNKVEVILDENAGITSLRVRAFSAEDSKKLADAILSEAENFVNKMAARVQDDGVEFSTRQVKKAEAAVLDVNRRITDFRNLNKKFDPTATAASVLQISAKLEGELAKINAEIGALKNYMKPNSPKIQSLESKAAALRQQIESQDSRLADGKGSKLAELAEEYTALKLENKFALKRLEIALTGLESAQAEAQKKTRYLLRIVEPTLPQEAIEPRKIREILTVFFVCLISYTLLGLILAAVKDHIRP